MWCGCWHPVWTRTTTPRTLASAVPASARVGQPASPTHAGPWPRAPGKRRPIRWKASCCTSCGAKPCRWQAETGEEASPMCSMIMAITLLAGLAGQAAAGPAEEAQRLYADFVAAQNANDLARVRSLLLDSPGFLWVTNGLSVWGPDAAIARLARFHANEVWRIDPDQDRARAVEVAADAAFLHVPLVLTVGPVTRPERYHILITALCAGTPAGWRIAALFTTDENRGEAGP